MFLGTIADTPRAVRTHSSVPMLRKVRNDGVSLGEFSGLPDDCGGHQVGSTARYSVANQKQSRACCDMLVPWAAFDAAAVFLMRSRHYDLGAWNMDGYVHPRGDLSTVRYRSYRLKK
jgi:hypothetical protein